MFRKEILDIIGIKTKLLFKFKKRAIIFELASIGELQFFKNILVAYLQQFPRDIVYIAHKKQTGPEFDRLLPQCKGQVIHIPWKYLEWGILQQADLFLTTEQYHLGRKGVYSICLFHGQPSKGLTFNAKIVDSFDAFFMYGPLHRQALQEYLADEKTEKPSHLELYDIGYSKSDELLQGRYDPRDVLHELGLDLGKKTVLYAPAFNEGASLRECGEAILETLLSSNSYNVIAKLPIDCLEPTTNLYATGGVNWFERIRCYESQYRNFRLCRDLEIDKVLACSDLLITCVSSVSFEFLALNKPVIFIDTPKFFHNYLRKIFPEKDTASWAERTTVNGGREFGLLVKDVVELIPAVETVLNHPGEYPRRQSELKKLLLYNPGNASQVAVQTIKQLLDKKVKTKRIGAKGSFRHSRRNFLPLLERLLPFYNFFLHSLGFHIEKTGCGFCDARNVQRGAKAAKLSVAEYLDSLEADPRKHGKRERVAVAMQKYGVLSDCQRICEIGPGSGRYMEKIIASANPEIYEVYETAPDWVRYLKATYGKGRQFHLYCQPADGRTLNSTASSSCDLVHAHAVFVYIPLLHILEYIREAARVCKNEKYVVFDYIPDSSFSLAVAQAWLNSEWRFPVVVSERLLFEFCQKHHLELVHSFREPYGASFSQYMIFRKLPYAGSAAKKE